MKVKHQHVEVQANYKSFTGIFLKIFDIIIFDYLSIILFVEEVHLQILIFSLYVFESPVSKPC